MHPFIMKAGKYLHWIYRNAETISNILLCQTDSLSNILSWMSCGQILPLLRLIYQEKGKRCKVEHWQHSNPLQCQM